MNLREAAQQALEEWRTDPGSVRMASLMMALEAALAEPEQEPTHIPESWATHGHLWIAALYRNKDNNG